MHNAAPADFDVILALSLLFSPLRSSHSLLLLLECAFHI